MRMSSYVLLVASAMFFFSSCQKHIPGICNCSPGDYVSNVSVFSTGLNNPRGLKFGPDGYLYVAEGGIGGTNPAGNCMGVPPPVGPYLGSDTGSRISRISPAGVRSTFVNGLPSSETAPTQGNLISGVGDVAFIGNTLYAVLSGAGCSHGVSIPNGVIRVNPNRSWNIIADLSAYQMSHPVKNPQPADFEPDGTWYSMIDVDNDLYAIEPNHGELDKITPKGAVSRVIDISAFEGHIVPTTVVWHNGYFYVGNLDLFPITAGSSSIYRISPGGAISVYATGFTSVVGVTFDQLGGLYVLENTTGNPFPTPGTGDIIRIDPSGTRTTIAAGLNLPTAMTFGPDNKLYVSAWGFGGTPGMGEIDQVAITCSKQTYLSK